MPCSVGGSTDPPYQSMAHIDVVSQVAEHTCGYIDMHAQRMIPQPLCMHVFPCHTDRLQLHYIPWYVCQEHIPLGCGVAVVNGVGTGNTCHTSRCYDWCGG